MRSGGTQCSVTHFAIPFSHKFASPSFCLWAGPLPRPPMMPAQAPRKAISAKSRPERTKDKSASTRPAQSIARARGEARSAPIATGPLIAHRDERLRHSLGLKSRSGKAGALHDWEAKYGAKVIKNKGNQVVVKFPEKTVKFDCKTDCVAELFKK